jgi:hypothetical protein
MGFAILRPVLADHPFAGQGKVDCRTKGARGSSRGWCGMRHIAKTDANQADIVHALRLAGCSVELLHGVGSGCPDILAGAGGQGGWLALMEIKDGAKDPSKQALTKDQVVWHARWRGPVHIVNSVDQALAVVAHYRRKAA